MGGGRKNEGATVVAHRDVVFDVALPRHICVGHLFPISALSLRDCLDMGYPKESPLVEGRSGNERLFHLPLDFCNCL